MLIARSVHPLPGEAERKERLLSLVDGFSSRRLLVIGDLIADEFIYGEVARVSREAPVLILKYDATEIVGGGAANAANNVAALSGRARLLGIVGREPEARRLVASLHRGIDRRHIVADAKFRTPVKTRILAGGIHAARQQVVRIDREAGWPIDPRAGGTIARGLRRAIDGCDGVLLSDYGSGLVTPALAAEVRRVAASRSRRRPIPVLLDSRYRLLDYRSLTACTPNESEVEQLIGAPLKDDARALERAGRMLLKRTRMGAVLVTRGSRGMALFERGQPTVHIPIFGSDEVTDVTGAGDTVIATFGLALAAGASHYEAAKLANYAGGLVVMKRGTATVTPAELGDAVASDHDTATESWSQEGPEQGRRSARQSFSERV
ncbi:MAG TPA: PfkB family carbohydrate kinase [Vicinamibacterales bacterium]|nr:PfkB family carbohydrate kinase [Vicinamibacterales bacterium]